MAPDLVHFALCLLIVGTLFRIFEYHFADNIVGKFLIFSY